jgi:hypothetical protein
MKKTLFATFLCVLATMCSCRTDESLLTKEQDCSKIYCGGIPGPIVFELRDSQDRDLLNKSTPGYYDTAQIRTLNDRKIQIIPAGNQAYGGSKDRNRLVWGFTVVENLKMKLPNGATDDLIVKFDRTPVGCCFSYKLSSFTYNGVSYPEVFTQYFIVKK